MSSDRLLFAKFSEQEILLEQRRQAADFIAEQYSAEREERELISIWEQVLVKAPSGVN